MDPFRGPKTDHFGTQDGVRDRDPFRDRFGPPTGPSRGPSGGPDRAQVGPETGPENHQFSVVDRGRSRDRFWSMQNPFGSRQGLGGVEGSAAWAGPC